jgi:NAD(P)-dependent dehydrogenase (short-subunit alcohol dehydrogenase family)
MSNPLDFSGKAALVTGGASGMGLATAQAFAEAGAAVVLADLKEDAAKAAAQKLVAAGHEALAVRCDVGDDAQVAAMVDRTVVESGRLDAAFNNASVGALTGNFSAFAASLIVARVLCGHLPDRLGGARVALACALLEAAGLALVWLAPGRVSAAVGAALAGFGYSLVYPGLGIEAVRRVPPESRGLAMGAYTACLDLALGVAAPALGLVAGGAGLGAVFLAAGLAVLGAAAVAAWLLTAPSLAR